MLLNNKAHLKYLKDLNIIYTSLLFKYEEQRLKMKQAKEDLEKFLLTSEKIHSTVKYRWLCGTHVLCVAPMCCCVAPMCCCVAPMCCCVAPMCCCVAPMCCVVPMWCCVAPMCCCVAPMCCCVGHPGFILKFFPHN